MSNKIEMNIKPVRTKRIYQEIIGSFVDFIANEEIKVGDKLPSERELSERFKVSRPSVREALLVLQTVGLIDIRAGGGAYMTSFNIGPFLDLFSPLVLKRKKIGLELLELRQLLEERAAVLAAKNNDPVKIKKLEQYLNTMKKASLEKDNDKGVESDIKFHKYIFELTDNIIMITSCELINSLMEISIKDARGLVLLQRAETPSQLFEEHKAIYEAIIAHDHEEAARAMNKHLSVVRAVYTKYYEDQS